MNPEFFYGHTDTGRQRDNNEDAFIAETVQGGKYIAACVIDGVGGYEGGEIAASIAKETIREKINDHSGDLLQLMRSSFSIANQRIYEERMANSKTGNMACVLTMALVDLENNQFYYSHVGDTRLYLFRDQSLVKLTRDHSFVGFLEDSKKLSEEEAMRHPKRNEINKALGFDPNMSSVADYIETGSSPFLPGDILLLCSDGLSDMVDSQSMISILTSSKSLEHKTNALINSANEAGGKDNITVVLVHNNKKPVKQRATKPVIVKKKDHQNETHDEEIKDTPVVLVKKTGGKGIAFLTVLCLLLGAAVFYLWNYPRVKEPLEAKETAVAVPIKRNTPEQKFFDSINTTRILSINDSMYGKNILVTDSILIKKDSFHLDGNGITIQADSSFKRAAFIIDSSCRMVIFEDIVFQNFDIAILTSNKNLSLRNVRFINCRIPVQSSFLLPQNVFVNGHLNDTGFFKTDSLPKK